MPFIMRKAVRQMLMQTALLDKIEREQLPVDTSEVRQRLHMIREQVRGTSSVKYVQRWVALLNTGDLDLIRRVVLADDEPGREMRNLSLLGRAVDRGRTSRRARPDEHRTA